MLDAAVASTFVTVPDPDTGCNCAISDSTDIIVLFVQKRRPFEVPSDVLNPTMCVSNVGIATSKSFSPALVSPAKVHTSLLSMLIANEMTEDMITELLGTGNSAPLMNSLIQPGNVRHLPVICLVRCVRREEFQHDLKPFRMEICSRAVRRAHRQTCSVGHRPSSCCSAARSGSLHHAPPCSRFSCRRARGIRCSSHRPRQASA